MAGDDERISQDYLDFELEIGPGQGREYPLAVLHSPAGEARGQMHFPFDALALERYADKLQLALLRAAASKGRLALSDEERAVQEFGGALFEALLNGEVRDAFRGSLERAAQAGLGLRLKLRIAPPELAALPWEFIYDARQAGYVCLSARTPLVRYLECPQPVRPLSARPPLRLLGMIASPRGAPGLDVESEKARMQRALAGLQRRGLVELEWLETGTWRELQRALHRGPWHVFHFVGHGRYDAVSDEGQLLLCDQDGERYPLGATRLALLLTDHAPLRLAALNACEGARSGDQDVFSSTAATLVRRGLPAVLAMQYPIADRAAIELAQTFYEALADGLPVDAAVVEARKAIKLALEGSLDWGAPVLFTRAPDGVLFEWAADERRRAAEGARQAAQAAEQKAGGRGKTAGEYVGEDELERVYTGGLSAFWLGDWEAAKRHFGWVLERRADYQQAADRLAQVEREIELAALYEQARQASQAEKWAALSAALGRIEALRAGYPDPDGLRVRLARRQEADSRLRRALEAMGKGEWAQAEQDLQRLLELEPGHPRAPGLLERARAGQKTARVAALKAEAEAALAGEDWDAAIEKLEALLELEPAHPRAPGLLERARAGQKTARFAALKAEAEAALAGEDWGLAIEKLEALRELEPGNRWASEKLEAALKQPLEIQLAPGVGLLFVRIPACEFLMGSRDDDKGAYSDEKPQHSLYLDDYWIGQYPVTNAQFEAFFEATGHCTTAEERGESYTWTGSEWKTVKGACWKHPSGPKSDLRGVADHPVVHVSWDDAVAFCEWASEVAKREVRLPSEAEWEKAARGANGRIYPWGDEPPDERRCNFGGKFGGTTPVGKYSPQGDSPYGCADMAGNVWEWTRSLWGKNSESPDYKYPYDPGDGREDPGSRDLRVLRGGAFHLNPGYVRCAYRYGYLPDNHYDDDGFRVRLPH